MSLTPRAVVLAGLVLVGCSSPSGTPVDFCGPDWSDVEPIIVTASQAEPEAVPILCVRRIGQERIRVGFEMPAGPDCHRLAGVELDESAEDVAITVLVAPADDPLAGACPPGAARATTEVDLQAPIEERLLLDGSQGDE
jgi:hypothetical protein